MLLYFIFHLLAASRYKYILFLFINHCLTTLLSSPNLWDFFIWLFIVLLFLSSVLLGFQVHMWKCLKLSHRTLRICSLVLYLFLFCFLLRWSLLIHLQLHWFFLLPPPVCYWVHLVSFSFQLLSFQL